MPTVITYIHQVAYENGEFVTQNYATREQLCESGDSFMSTYSNQQVCYAAPQPVSVLELHNRTIHTTA